MHFPWIELQGYFKASGPCSYRVEYFYKMPNGINVFFLKVLRWEDEEIRAAKLTPDSKSKVNVMEVGQRSMSWSMYIDL